MAACSFPDNTNRKWYLSLLFYEDDIRQAILVRNSVYPVIVRQVGGKIFIHFRRAKKKKRIHLKPMLKVKL